MGFWLSKEHADIIEDVTDGDNRLYETLLGFDEGHLLAVTIEHDEHDEDVFRKLQKTLSSITNQLLP